MQRERKVVLVGPIAPFKGGISAFNTSLANAFTDAGHHVQAIAWHNGMIGVPRSEQLDSRMPLHDSARYLLKWYSPRSWLYAGMHAAQYQPDLLIVHWAFPEAAPIYAVINAVVKRRSPATEIVYIVHNATPHEPHISFRFMEQLCFRNVSRFMVHSIADKTQLSQKIPEAQIHSGFHPVYDRYSKADHNANKRPSKPEFAVWISQNTGHPMVLFFGYVKPYKGLDLLLQALKVFGKARLIVAGQFSKPCEYLREQADSYGLSKRIFWLDRYIADDEVTDIFALADIVALPYRHASVSGIASIALAFGVPVVATGVGGLSESIENGSTGYVVPPGDPNRLAQALEKAYLERNRMKIAIRQTRDTKSWNRYCEILLSWAKLPTVLATKNQANQKR